MKLQELYNDKEALDEIKNHLHETVVKHGVDKMLNEESTVGVGIASKMIEEAFNELETLFGSKTKPTKKTKNEAR